MVDVADVNFKALGRKMMDEDLFWCIAIPSALVILGLAAYCCFGVKKNKSQNSPSILPRYQEMSNSSSSQLRPPFFPPLPGKGGQPTISGTTSLSRPRTNLENTWV